MDTRARTSSLNTTNLLLFEKHRQSRVRSSAIGKNKKLVIERPVVRKARIPRAGAQTTQRYVIDHPACVAGRSAEAEVTLANRSGMNYKLLIGRSFLRNWLLVGSAATFLAKRESPGTRR
jgi:hypothetical protein